MSKYVYSENVHNLQAPEIIVPEILNLIKAKSVADIGCGLGTFLHVFKKHGIEMVMGYDGKWVNKELLFRYINEDEFTTWDLEKEIKPEKKCDLAISLEVAEHISGANAEIFVQSLLNCGEVVVFSAAIPYQGGQNHINEQWLTYWEEIFARHCYEMHDILRPLFWDNEAVFTWYKQNIVVFAPKGYVFASEPVYSPFKNLVHYNLYMDKSKGLQNLIAGRKSPVSYFKYLLKSIFGAYLMRKVKDHRSRKREGARKPSW